MQRLFLPVLLAAALGAADIAVVEEIVAKVNGDIITRGELDRTRRLMEQAFKAQAKGANVDAQLAERSKDILRERIDNLLLINRGKELNINVDAEFSKYQAEIMRQFKVSDTETFAKLVREQVGQNFEDWRSETKNSMITQRVIRQEVGSKINIPKEDVRKYYDEHQKDFLREEVVYLREILLATEGKDAAAVEKKAKDIAARAKKGERFTDLARDNSDSATAAQGGEIPPFKKGDLDKTIEDMLWDQPKGFVTEAMKRPNGWLILRVEEHVKAGQATFEEAENEIMGKLYQPRMEPAMREYLTKLRTDAFLEIREGWIDTAAAPGKSTKWTDPAQLKPETITKKELEAKGRRKRLLWTVPIPGTNTRKKTDEPAATTATTVATEGVSKSKTVKQ
jgi:peptidyl-prolyl cis-trans isomerase SurA